MKILHLTLKKKRFDTIANGEKKEEYREINHYWIKRLIWFHAEMGMQEFDEFCHALENSHVRFRSYNELFAHFLCEPAYFKSVHFARGGHFHPSLPQITAEFKGIEIREGNPAWGAEPGKEYFVIKLGNIIKPTHP